MPKKKKRTTKRKSSKESTRKSSKRLTISQRAKKTPAQKIRVQTRPQQNIRPIQRKAPAKLFQRNYVSQRTPSQPESRPIFTHKGRVPTGISGFDRMIGGGYEKDSINLIAGGGGTGKSIYAIQFLLEGLRRGESVLYVTFEEKKDDFFANMAEIGYDLAKAEKSGKFLFIEYSPEKVKMMLEEGGGAVESTILKNNVSRLVIDSVSSFSLLFDGESEKRQAILALFGMIRKWNVTSLFTVQYNPSDKDDDGLDALEFEADSITLLYFLSSGGTRQRFIEVVKMRGTDHSKSVHVFEIMHGGIKIGPKARMK